MPSGWAFGSASAAKQRVASPPPVPGSPSVASQMPSVTGQFYTPKTSFSHFANIEDSPSKALAVAAPVNGWQFGPPVEQEDEPVLQQHSADWMSVASPPQPEEAHDEAGNVRVSQRRLTAPEAKQIGCLCLGGFWRGSRLVPDFIAKRRKSRPRPGSDTSAGLRAAIGRSASHTRLEDDPSPVLVSPRHFSTALRSSASDTNSEFWDAVEMLDDLAEGGREEGEESVVRVELLSRAFDITIRSSSGVIPVSFILTETIRRYAGLKVFHDEEGARNHLPTSPAGSLGSVDVHRLIPACRGLLNKRTGERHAMEGQLVYEGLVGDTFVVDIDRRQLGHDASPPQGRGRGATSASSLGSNDRGGLLPLPPPPSSTQPNPLAKVEFPLTAVPRFPGLDGDGNNCWSQPDATEFVVRGLTYMQDKVKVPSAPAPYRLLGVDLLLSDDKHSCVSQRRRGFVSRCRANPVTAETFIFVVNFSLPWGSFIAYFCPVHEGSSPFTNDAKLDPLLKRFLEGDNDFRNQRLKLIPRCVEGPWMVKSAVGTTPAIMGTKILHTYYSTPNCFEVEVDISSSVPAQYILGVVKSFTSIVSVDLAFVLQGEEEAELPERVLFAVRFHHLAVSKAPAFDTWQDEQQPGVSDE